MKACNKTQVTLVDKIIWNLPQQSYGCLFSISFCVSTCNLVSIPWIWEVNPKWMEIYMCKGWECHHFVTFCKFLNHSLLPEDTHFFFHIRKLQNKMGNSSRLKIDTIICQDSKNYKVKLTISAVSLTSKESPSAEA